MNDDKDIPNPIVKMNFILKLLTLQSDTDTLYYTDLLHELDDGLSIIKTPEDSWIIYQGDVQKVELVTTEALENYIDAYISTQQKMDHFTKQINIILADLATYEDEQSSLTSSNQRIHSFLPNHQISFDRGNYKVSFEGATLYKTESFNQLQNYITKLLDYSPKEPPNDGGGEGLGNGESIALTK